jgi:hypothetical protein
MTLAITTVCSSIAALTVAGVTICDLDNIPPSGERLTPILFPNPENPISNIECVSESYGGGSSRLMDVDYDLNYVFIYCKMGAGRTGLDYFEDCMLAIQSIYDEVLEIDTFTGGVDILPTSSIQLVTMTDPAGNNYLGCAMTFHVKEFWR